MAPRVRLMTMKADLFAKAGRPMKGLSLAMKAAAISWRARILPAFFGAYCTIANILLCLSEFKAAEQALDSIMPQV